MNIYVNSGSDVEIANELQNGLFVYLKAANTCCCLQSIVD